MCIHIYIYIYTYTLIYIYIYIYIVCLYSKYIYIFLYTDIYYIISLSLYIYIYIMYLIRWEYLKTCVKHVQRWRTCPHSELRRAPRDLVARTQSQSGTQLWLCVAQPKWRGILVARDPRTT